jgi:hypothetical protein
MLVHAQLREDTLQAGIGIGRGGHKLIVRGRGVCEPDRPTSSGSAQALMVNRTYS